MCVSVCLSVCVSDSAHAVIGWLKINHRPQTESLLLCILTSNLHLYTGCVGEITRYMYSGYGIVVSVLACHAKDRRFNSRYSQHMQMAFSRRAMQRETIPDTKNVISQLKAIKLPFKSNTQRKKKTKPQKDSYSVSPVGQMVKVFDCQLKGPWFKSSQIQKNF